MRLEFDNPRYCDSFIRLNEQWITEYFSIEEVDKRLAENPMQIVECGGHIISLVEVDRVIGVCALFKESDDCFQLARMAVDTKERGKGYGDVLIKAAIGRASSRGAKIIYLVSNTVLTPAISLYRKHGFIIREEGQHPVYARANIIMERSLQIEGESRVEYTVF
jgi:GNAT superfamily N-acetyltransferase